jgi:hypothetical protein
MGFQDEYIKSLMKNQFGTRSSLTGMHKQLLEAQGVAIKSLLDEQKFSAGKAVAGMLAEMKEQQRERLKGLGASVLNDFRGFRTASLFSDSLRQSLAYSPIHGNLALTAAKTFADVADSIKPLYAGSIADVIGKIKVDTNKFMGGFAESAAIAAMGSLQPKFYESLQSSFARSMADAFKTAFEVSEEDEEAFEPVQQLIEEKVAELPRNRVAAEGLWRIVYEVLLALLAAGQVGTGLYQISDAKQSSATQAAQFNQFMTSLQRIASNTENLIPEHDENTYYVVERAVDLKVKPTGRSAIISALSPNQKVRLVQMNHEWIYVEYFDYLEGVPKYGWAMKKYFKRLS